MATVEIKNVDVLHSKSMEEDGDMLNFSMMILREGSNTVNQYVTSAM